MKKSKIKDGTFVDENELPEFEDSINKFLESKSNVEFKTRLTGKNNEVIWTKILFAAVEDESEFIGIGTITDITEIVKANNELKEKQSLIDVIEKDSKIGFWVRDFKIDSNSLWSDSVYRIFDIEKSDGPIPFSKIDEILFPDDRAGFYKSIQRIKSGKFANYSFRIFTSTKTIKYLMVSAFPIFDLEGNVTKMSGTVSDLTDVHLIDKELSNQKKMLQRALEVARIGHWEFNPREKSTIWSKETKRIFGLKENEPPYSVEVFIAIVHPDDRQGFTKFYESQTLGAKPASFQYRVFIKGELKTIHSYSFAFLGPDNQVEKLTGIVIDKTQIGYDEASKKESENLFLTVFDNLPDAIYIEDQLGTILNANKKACELQGYKKSEIIGKNILDFAPREVKNKLMSDFNKIFTGEIDQLKGKCYKITGEVLDINIQAMKIDYRNIPAVMLNVTKA